MIVNNTKIIGNYILSRWNSWNYDIAIIPSYSSSLFESKNKLKLSNVLIYINKESFEDSKNFPMFLAVNLAKDHYFNVVISTKYDSSPAENADIIINMFSDNINNSNENENFLDVLEEYNDGSRLFIDNNMINNISSREDFKNFVKKLKNNLVN